MEIIVVTGKVDAGKTAWCRRNLIEKGGMSTDGVLLVKILRGRGRIGYDALRCTGREQVPFSRLSGREPENWHPVEYTGPFSISGPGKQRANHWIREACQRGVRRLVIDEAGPLELAGGGLSEGIFSALKGSPALEELYLVVRNGLVEPVSERFGIGKFRLVEVS